MHDSSPPLHLHWYSAAFHPPASSSLARSCFRRTECIVVIGVLQSFDSLNCSVIASLQFSFDCRCCRLFSVTDMSIDPRALEAEIARLRLNNVNKPPQPFSSAVMGARKYGPVVPPKPVKSVASENLPPPAPPLPSSIPPTPPPLPPSYPSQHRTSPPVAAPMYAKVGIQEQPPSIVTSAAEATAPSYSLLAAVAGGRSLSPARLKSELGLF